jgi:hypothetical protein
MPGRALQAASRLGREHCKVWGLVHFSATAIHHSLLLPIREPAGTVPILRSPRSKMGLSPSPARFSDRLLVNDRKHIPDPLSVRLCSSPGGFLFAIALPALYSGYERRPPAPSVYDPIIDADRLRSCRVLCGMAVSRHISAHVCGHNGRRANHRWDALLAGKEVSPAPTSKISEKRRLPCLDFSTREFTSANP